MRAPKTKDGHAASYNAALCRATARLRRRLAAAVDRVDALEAELRAEWAAIATERDALIERLESPEAARDVMLLARDLLNKEVIEAASQRQLCQRCGGLGHGMTAKLLAKPIADHCKRHDLPQEPPPDHMDQWPTLALGSGLAGRYRDPTWLVDPPSARRRAAAIW